MVTRATRRRSVLPPLIVGAVVIVGGMLLVHGVGTSGVGCSAVDPSHVGTADVAGYSGDQLVNAATIMDTASSMGLDRHAQLLGVMAAMGESSLHVLPYGDHETDGVVNPDGTPTTSIGLFQQQEWWGSEADRLDPVASSTLFFHRLVTVADWETRPASMVIHEVQINSDPDHYAPYEQPADAVVTALRSTCH